MCGAPHSPLPFRAGVPSPPSPLPLLPAACSSSLPTQLTQKKSTMQFKTLDSTVSTVNKDTGQKQAMTYRRAPRPAGRGEGGGRGRSGGTKEAPSNTRN